MRRLEASVLLSPTIKTTRASGHGRLRNQDGTVQDIGASTGGLLRTVLDDWRPPVLEVIEGGVVASSASEDVDDAGMDEEESVDWS